MKKVEDNVKDLLHEILRRIQAAGLSNTEVKWLAERVLDAEKESHKRAAFVIPDDQ